MHGAAHVFVENKLEDLATDFNKKFTIMDQFIRKELHKLHDIHMGEIKKLKVEVGGNNHEP